VKNKILPLLSTALIALSGCRTAQADPPAPVYEFKKSNSTGVSWTNPQTPAIADSVLTLDATGAPLFRPLTEITGFPITGDAVTISNTAPGHIRIDSGGRRLLETTSGSGTLQLGQTSRGTIIYGNTIALVPATGNAVQIGGAGAPARLTNLDTGTAGADAVNKTQLDATAAALTAALAAKQDALTAGDGIAIAGGTISATGSISAGFPLVGDGIAITNPSDSRMLMTFFSSVSVSNTQGLFITTPQQGWEFHSTTDGEFLSRGGNAAIIDHPSIYLTVNGDLNKGSFRAYGESTTVIDPYQHSGLTLWSADMDNAHADLSSIGAVNIQAGLDLNLGGEAGIFLRSSGGSDFQAVTDNLTRIESKYLTLISETPIRAQTRNEGQTLQRIKIADPIDADDAVTKGYADAHYGTGTGGGGFPVTGNDAFIANYSRARLDVIARTLPGTGTDPAIYQSVQYDYEDGNIHTAASQSLTGSGHAVGVGDAGTGRMDFTVTGQRAQLKFTDEVDGAQPFVATQPADIATKAYVDAVAGTTGADPSILQPPQSDIYIPLPRSGRYFYRGAGGVAFLVPVAVGWYEIVVANNQNSAQTYNVAEAGAVNNWAGPLTHVLPAQTFAVLNIRYDRSSPSTVYIWVSGTGAY
jgi:hypothetical protein